MADWKVTSVTDIPGAVYIAHPANHNRAWQSPDGVVYDDLDALEQAAGTCEPYTVDGLPELVAEVDLLMEACEAHEAARAAAAEQVADLKGQLSAARAAVLAARRALMGAPTLCGVHLTEFAPGELCCARPRDNFRALRAIDAVYPQLSAQPADG